MLQISVGKRTCGDITGRREGVVGALSRNIPSYLLSEGCEGGVVEMEQTCWCRCGGIVAAPEDTDGPRPCSNVPSVSPGRDDGAVLGALGLSTLSHGVGVTLAREEFSCSDESECMSALSP